MYAVPCGVNDHVLLVFQSPDALLYKVSMAPNAVDSPAVNSPSDELSVLKEILSAVVFIVKPEVSQDVEL